MNKTILIMLVAALAAAGGWFFGRSGSTATAGGEGERKVAFYQSPMHPWIKSETPGQCTICGMDLVPVYEGDAGMAAAGDVVALNPSSVTVLNVQTQPVTRQALTRTLRVAGTIEDDDTRHRIISAYTEGRIDKLHVNYVGAEVVEGQPLAELYSPALLTAQREFVVLSRQGGEARLVEAARQRLIRLGLTEKQVNALGEKQTGDGTEIVAPMTGTVVERNVYEGQYVAAGEKLFEIADYSTMWFVFDVYEKDIAFIREGLTVEVRTPSVPGETFSAPITFVNPEISSETRSAKVRAEIANPGRVLRHLAFAQGTVELETPEVLAVPRSAVLAPGQQPVVYVELAEGNYEPRPVKLGRAGDTHWEVLEGVAEGEKVVTSGNLLIDAQSHLNRGGETQVIATQAEQNDQEPEAATEMDLPAMAKANQAAVEALVKDDLAAYNVAVHTHPELMKELGHADDLAAARKAFHTLNLRLVAAVKASTDEPQLKIYECPMTKNVFPGAPGKAQWVQTAEPLMNPYAGQEMAECGMEVKR